MSAIWGIITLDRTKHLPEDCQNTFEQTYKQGCKIDRYEGIATKDAFFGCGIQYITSEAERECLPIYNKEQGILFTADCILDNREEIISRLCSKGHTQDELLNAADGSLLYLSYLTFGTDCVKTFRGLFSIAVWNETEGSLRLFSDPVSARSLYYINTDGLVAFSTRSEPLRSLFSVTPNENYDKDFLLSDSSTIYLVPGETPYKELFLLPPATELCFSAEGQKSTVYRNLQHVKRIRRMSPKKCRKQFLSLYRDCVRDALRTSGNVGIAMSSGLDSSSVGVLAAEELKKRNKPLFSYTFIPYETPPSYRKQELILDESVPIRELVKQYPNISATYLNNNGKNLFEDMPLCTNILEIPYKTGTFPNHYEMCLAGAGKGCKVFLNGAFGNNTVSFGHISNGLYDLYHKKRSLAFHSLLYRYAKHEKQNCKELKRRTLKRFREFEQRPKEFEKTFVPENIFVTPSILQGYNLGERFQRDPRIKAANGFLTAETYSDFLQANGLLIYLGIFETQFGLATGMVLRDPTKDIRMIEFCRQIPFSMFTCKGTPRWLIRGTFTGLLPDSFLEPWEQHGILNADWLLRVKRDWHTIKPELEHRLSSDYAKNWLAKDRIREYIENLEQASERTVSNFTYICAIDGLFRFRFSE